MFVHVGYGVITSGNSISAEHFTETWVIFFTYLQSSAFVLQQSVLHSFHLPNQSRTEYETGAADSISERAYLFRASCYNRFLSKSIFTLAHVYVENCFIIVVIFVLYKS